MSNCGPAETCIILVLEVTLSILWPNISGRACTREEREVGLCQKQEAEVGPQQAVDLLIRSWSGAPPAPAWLTGPTAYSPSHLCG